MKEVIQNLLKNRLEELLKDRVIETLPIEIRVDHSKDKTQGDFATNIAMVLSKQAKSSLGIWQQKLLKVWLKVMLLKNRDRWSWIY